jgi:hypothetical protein
MEKDPLRTVRLTKRVLVAGLALAVLAALLFGAWKMLPQDTARVGLRINTTAEAFLRGQPLGTGEILLDDATLRSAGVVVPADTNFEEIARALVRDEQFRGPLMVNTEGLPFAPGGYECYLRGDNWRVARVWVFEIEDGNWLAVPVEFRDAKGRVHTDVSDETISFGVGTSMTLQKNSHDEKSVTVFTVDGTFPRVGEMVIHPTKIR